MTIIDKRQRKHKYHGNGIICKHRSKFTFDDLLSIYKSKGRNQLFCKLGKLKIEKYL